MIGFVAVAAARRCGRREIGAVCEDQPPRVQRNRPPVSRRSGTPGRLGRKHAVAVVIDYSTALGDPGSVVGHCDLSTQGRVTVVSSPKSRLTTALKQKQTPRQAVLPARVRRTHVSAYGHDSSGPPAQGRGNRHRHRLSWRYLAAHAVVGHRRVIACSSIGRRSASTVELAVVAHVFVDLNNVNFT